MENSPCLDFKSHPLSFCSYLTTVDNRRAPIAASRPMIVCFSSIDLERLVPQLIDSANLFLQGFHHL